MSAPSEWFSFACPTCNANLEASTSTVGSVIQCPECGNPMRVPEEIPAPAASSTPRRTVVMRSQGASTPRAASRRPSPKKQKSPAGLIATLLVLAAGAGAYFYFTNTDKTPRETRSAGAPAFASSRNASTGGTGVQAAPPARAEGWNLAEAATVTAFQWGSAGRDMLTDMAVRPNGNLILTGTLGTKDGIPAAARQRHTLIDARGEQNFGYVAELSADGRDLLWFSTFGGELLRPTRVVLAPDGRIVLGGRALSRLRGSSPLVKGEFSGRESVIATISADGSRLEWATDGGPNQGEVTGIAVDGRGRILYTAGTRGKGQAAYVLRLNPDGSSSEFNGEWAIRFDVRTDAFKAPGQIGAFYALGASGDGYDYDGPGGWGPVRYNVAGMRQGGQIVVLPDGDFVVTGTLQYDFREGSNRWFPAFDLIVARFSPDGDLKWSTALYQEGDSIHTPDQKAKDLIYNPVNGDLYVLAIQHGSNVYRFKGDLYGNTGNLMIAWIGQVNAQNGGLKNGWYWMNSRQGNYNAAGRPLSPPYPSLAGNRPERLDVDSLGRIYFAGTASPKAWTTPNAWRAWPDTQSGGGNAALTVLSPNLDQIIYSSMIYGTSSDASSSSALAVTPNGVWVGGANGTSGFPAGPQPPFARPTPADRDAFLVNFRF